MTLPEQVRKQVERANALLEAQNQPTGEPASAPAPAEPPAEPPAPASAQAEPTPQPPAPPAPAPAPEDDPNSESWKHKYLTLQGVLTAETARRDAQLRTQDERIRALETQLTTAQAPAPAPTPTPKAARQFSEAELERFGPELLNLVYDKAETLADEVVTRKLAEFTPKITEVENQVKAVGQTVYESKEHEFWGELRKAVPDVDAVNAMPTWLVWLGQEDDISGVRRQAILDSAAQRLDHQRVAKLFKAFKTAAGIPDPTAAPASAPAPAVPPAPPISPSPRTVGTGGSGPTPREPEAASVKRSEIAAHYRKSSTDLTYRSSKEYVEMEQRIAQATAAGRVMNA